MSKEEFRRRDSTARDLDPREERVLRAVIEEHLRTGTPVGSKSLPRRYGLGVSPALVRSVMLELGRKGYFVQPHPSAGRLPTDKAYRYYVDRLLEGRTALADEPMDMEVFFGDREMDLAELMRVTSRRLSMISHFTGLATSPDLRWVALRRIEFVRLGAGHLLALFVTETGVMENRIVLTPDDVKQDDLDKYSNYLNSLLGGLTLTELRNRILAEMENEQALHDLLTGPALALGLRALKLEGKADLFVEGKENLLDLVGSHGADLVKALIRDLEDKNRILELLEKAMASRGVEVFIGAEGDLDVPAGMSVVTSTYQKGKNVLGTVGILGPSRMNYTEVITLVEFAGRLLTRALDPVQ